MSTYSPENSREMDGLELLQTLNLANMNGTIQAIFQWFQKKVGSLGSRLEAYADGVSENRPNASKWNFRNPAPFTTQRHSPEATSGLSGGLARLPLTKGNFTVSIYNATHQISTNWSSIPTPHASSRIRSQSATQELSGFQSNHHPILGFKCMDLRPTIRTANLL